jgi:hypothetical protein
MILKRYGSTLHSVDPNFNSRALTEIGFRRNRQVSIDEDEFSRTYDPVRTEEVSAEAEGAVFQDVEHAVLEELERKLRAVEADLGEGEVLLVENEQAVDPPKTRHGRKASSDGAAGMVFRTWVEPSLKIGVYRKRR